MKKFFLFFLVLAIILPLLSNIKPLIANEDCDWPIMKGNPLRNGISNCGPRTNELTESWLFSAGSIGYGGAVIGNGKVYFTNCNLETNYEKEIYVYCVDDKTGKMLWKVPSNGWGSTTSPLYYKDRLYYVTYTTADDKFYYENNFLYCLDAKNGSELWKVQAMSSIWNGPVAYNGKIFFGSSNEVFFCVDALSGKTLWTYNVGSGFGDASPVIKDGMIYAFARNTLYCLSESGSYKWNLKLQLSDSTPAVEGYKMYMGSDAGKLICINLKKGEIAWEFNATNPISMSPVVKDGLVYFGTYSTKDKPNYTKFYCLNGETGAKVWQMDFTNNDDLYSSPAISENRLYLNVLNQSGDLYCLDIKNKGKIVSKIELKSPVIAPLSIANRALYVFDFNGNLHKLNETLVSPSIVDFGGVDENTTKTLELTVGNPFENDTEIKITTDIDWLKIEKNLLKVKASSTAKIKLSLVREKMIPKGTLHSGTILVMAGLEKMEIKTKVFINTNEVTDVGTGWPMNGYNPEHTNAPPSTSSPLSNELIKEWNIKVDDNAQNYALSCSNKKLFISSGQQEIKNNLVYFKGFTHFIDADTGFLRKTIDSPTIESTCAVDKDRVYLGSIYGLSCINTSNYKEAWLFNTGWNGNNSFISPKPTFFAEKLYFCGSNSIFYCLDSGNGSKIWSYQLSENEISKFAPAIWNGMVYLVTDSIYCFDAGSGQLHWRSEIGTAFTTPTIYNGKIYFATGSGEVTPLSSNSSKTSMSTLFCLDARTGNSVWSYKSKNKILNPICANRGRIFIANLDQNLYCFDSETGDVVWSNSASEDFGETLVYCGGRLFVGTNGNKLLGFDAMTGRLTWKFDTIGAVDTQPIVAEGWLFCITKAGQIYGFKSKPVKPSQIKIIPEKPIMEPDSTLRFSASILGDDKEPIWNDDVTWKTTPEDVGVIDKNGLFTAKAEGVCTVEAKFGELTEMVMVKVVNQIPPSFLDMLDFGELIEGDEKTIDLAIKNMSKQKIEVRASTNDDWYSIDRSSIIIGINSFNKLKLTVKKNEAKPGTMKIGTVNLDWGSGSGQVKVKMSCKAPSFSESIIDFGIVEIGDTPIKEILIRNKSDKPLELTLKTEPWIVAPAKLIIEASSEEELKILLESSVLQNPGQYKTTIAVFWGTNIYEITVKVTVTPDKTPPKIEIDSPKNVKSQSEYNLTGKFERGSNVIVNDQVTKIEGDRFSIACKLKPAPSLNSFKIIAIDKVGNKTELTFEVVNVYDKIVSMTIGKEKMIVNGVEKSINPPPTIMKGATMVPVRAVADAFGATTQWIGETQSVIITFMNTKVILLIGSEDAFINDKPAKVKPPATKLNGKTMIPFRFIAEALGAKVEYKTLEKTIIMTLEIRP